MEMIRHLITAAFLGSALLHAQTPPPPPPPEEGGGTDGGGRSFDLSKIPVPEEDKKAAEPELSAEERQGIPIMLSVVPVGYVPPPIIKIGKDGMPREEYRHPLEYPPVVYHVKTKKGSIRVMGPQNQIGPATRIPRTSRISLSYEMPPGEEAVSDDAGPRLRMIGEFGVERDTTHLVVVLWKDPDSVRWTSPKFKVIDASPAKMKRNEVVVVNASGRDLAVHRGDKPYQIRPGFMGRLEMAVDGEGRIPLVVAAPNGPEWAQLSKTVIGPRSDERVFVVAWRTPKSPAQPSGVSVNAASKRMTTPEPFAKSKS